MISIDGVISKLSYSCITTTGALEIRTNLEQYYILN